MKPSRAFALLIGTALLGGIAKFNEMPADAKASMLGNAMGTADTAGRSLLSAAVSTYKGAMGKAGEFPVRVSIAAPGSEGGETPRPLREPRPAEPPSGNPLWALPVSRLSNTRDHPIFSPSRRPPPPPPVSAPQVAPKPPVKPAEPEQPAVSLVGTIIGAGDDRLGVFIDSSTKAIVRLRVGETHRGWLVRLISPRTAILVKTGQPAVALQMPPPGGGPPPKLSGRDTVLNVVWKVGAD